MNNLCERHGRLRCGECAYIERLEEERQKLIEGLRMCLFNHGCWREEDYVAYIRDLLKEIGVTVE